MAKIFINYRRAESLKDARHLAKLIDTGPFRGRIFIDLKGLDGAPDWLHELERQVASSDAMISIICPDWAEVRDGDGKRRIDNDKDFVRFELAEAFRRNIPVIPVLVDGARMPKGSELPDNLLYLTRPQAELLRAESFDADCAKIAKRVQAEIAARRKRGVPGWAAAAVAFGALTGGIGVGPTVMERAGLYQPPTGDGAAFGQIARLRADLSDADAAARSAQTARLKAEAEVARMMTEIARLTTASDTARKQADENRTLADNRAKEIASLKATAETLGRRAESSETAQAEAKRLAGLLTAAENARDAASAKADGLAKKVATLEAQVSQLTNVAAITKKVADTAKPTPAPLPISTSALFAPGNVFRDCYDDDLVRNRACPEMVVIPAGSFTMGSNDGAKDERPPHKVTIAKPFAVGKFEVTFAEWEACISGGGCTANRTPSDEGWGKERRPVINVSWTDAQQYVAWLSKKTGKTYRLLTESEWEYAARAGTTTQYAWGDGIGKGNANCVGCGSQWDKKQTAPVGSFKPNAFGLYDMHGNAREWVEDSYHPTYEGAPADGSAWTTGGMSSRVLRGGSWSIYPENLRSASRYINRPVIRLSSIGFRLARTL